MFLLNFYQGNDLKVRGVPLEDRVTIGRSAENGVVLADPSVSRRHAVFILEKSSGHPRVLLRDMGSTNGCEVNGMTFKGRTVPVEPPDVVRLGIYRVELTEKVPELAGLGDDEDGTIIYQGPPLCQESLPLDRLRSLHELTTAASGLAVDELLDATRKTIASCLRHDVLCVVVKDEGGAQMVRTWNAAGPCPPAAVAVSRKLLGKCLHENLAILADKRQKEQTSKTSEDSAVWNSLSCAVCAPLMSGASNLGAVYVSSEASGVFYDKDDLQFLILVAHQVSNNLASRKAMNDLRTEAQKLEAILESLQEGVLVADKDFVILSANGAATRLLGTDDLKSKRIEEALQGFRHTFDRKTIPGRNRFQLSIAPRAEGVESPGPRIYSATVSENAGPDPNSWKYVVSLHDVTHVERNERMKSILVNRLAHKLRTPLTVITGATTLLAQHAGEALDPELRDLLHQSVAHCEQCSALIEQFVEYTSLNLSRDTAATWDDCLLESLVSAAEESNRELVARKRFSIVRRFPDAVFRVRGKQENLSLAFHHIIQNAVKFGPEGGTLAINAVESHGIVRVQFCDDGPGIPPAERENLCQMLHQVDADNTGQVPGVGLGLWLVRAILQAHSGDISVTSPVDESGKGTLVEVHLLASAEVEAASEGPVTSRTELAHLPNVTLELKPLR